MHTGYVCVQTFPDRHTQLIHTHDSYVLKVTASTELVNMEPFLGIQG